jgi:hypothetical protein
MVFLLRSDRLQAACQDSDLVRKSRSSSERLAKNSKAIASQRVTMTDFSVQERACNHCVQTESGVAMALFARPCTFFHVNDFAPLKAIFLTP